MKKSLQSILILTATLALGIVIGILGSRFYLMMKVRQFQPTSPPRLLNRFQEEVLRPTPEQADTLRAIFRKYRPKFVELHQQFREETRTLLDSMQTELKPVLTKEQIRRLRSRRARPRPGHFSPRLRERGPGGKEWNQPPDPPPGMMPPE